MTLKEAYKAVDEMQSTLDPEHVEELLERLDHEWWVEWKFHMPQTD